jgi:hypothetical protein
LSRVSDDRTLLGGEANETSVEARRPASGRAGKRSLKRKAAFTLSQWVGGGDDERPSSTLVVDSTFVGASVWRTLFVLQQLEFDALLASLAPMREQAGEKYEFIRHGLLRYFESHRCMPAEECVDETIDGSPGVLRRANRSGLPIRVGTFTELRNTSVSSGASASWYCSR